MFECKYKFEVEDCVKCAKYVYKSQKRKQDKIIAILIPILMVAMIGMLIYDIIAKKNFMWDIILIVALAILEGMYLIIPFMLVRSQKKSYKKQNFASMDYLQIKIDENSSVETLHKDGKEVARNVHNLRNLTSYLEDSEVLVMVFNKVEYVCIKKDKLQ